MFRRGRQDRLVACQCRVVLPCLLQRVAETVVRLHMTWVDRDRVPQAGNGRLVPAEALQRDAEIEVEVGVLRVRRERRLEAGGGFLRRTGFELHHAKAGVRFGGGGIARQRLAKACDRRIVAPQVALRVAEQAEGLGVGPDRQRLLQAGHRRLVPSCLNQDDAEAAQQIGVVRPECERRLEALDCFVPALQAEQGDAEVAVILEAPAPGIDGTLEGDEPPEAIDRFARSALAVADDAEQIQRVGAVRLQPCHGGAGLRCRLQLPHAEQADGLRKKVERWGSHSALQELIAVDFARFRPPPQRLVRLAVLRILKRK